MDIALKNQFIELWSKYFGNSELPITFYFSKGDDGAKRVEASKGWSCLI